MSMFSQRELEVMYFDVNNIRRVATSTTPIFQAAQKAASEIATGGFYLEDGDVIIPPSRIIQVKIN